MLPALSRDQLRDIDRRAVEQFAVPSLLLMENAGRGAADLLRALHARGPIALCCGKGNNGGDALVLARHLAVRGIPAEIHLFADPAQLSPDAAAQWEMVERFDLPRRVWSLDALADKELQREWAKVEWLVDGLFGTGLTGPIRSPLDRVVAVMNACPAPILALDLPSGLDADSGEPLGLAIRAKHTATFAALKQGFANPAAHAFTGRIHVVDIGIPIFPAPTTM